VCVARKRQKVRSKGCRTRRDAELVKDWTLRHAHGWFDEQSKKKSMRGWYQIGLTREYTVDVESVIFDLADRANKDTGIHERQTVWHRLDEIGRERMKEGAAYVVRLRTGPSGSAESRGCALSQARVENRIPHRQPCREVGLSRMNIRGEMKEERDDKLEANLYKLRDVASVESISDSVAITRELAMIKIRTGTPLAIVLPHVMDEFRVRVVNRSSESLILEVTGTVMETDRLIELLRPIGILEVARSGTVAMAIGTLSPGHTGMARDI
jgi:acetolactate synthase small subunit